MSFNKFMTFYCLVLAPGAGSVWWSNGDAFAAFMCGISIGVGVLALYRWAEERD